MLCALRSTTLWFDTPPNRIFPPPHTALQVVFCVLWVGFYLPIRFGTTRWRDDGMTRDWESLRTAENYWGVLSVATENTAILRRSQSFSGVLRRSQSFSVVRSCAWPLVVRVVQMWCQVEVWLDGGVLGVHSHSDERAWCRRCAAITTSAWWEKGAECYTRQKCRRWVVLARTSHWRHFLLGDAIDPLSRQEKLTKCQFIPLGIPFEMG